MTLSIDTQFSNPSETLGVRTHNFARHCMVATSILHQRGRTQVRGRSPNHPLMHNGVISVDEVSHTNMSKLHDLAPAQMGVNAVAQGKVGRHSTRT